MTLDSGHSVGTALRWVPLFSALAMVFLRSMSGGEHAITITFYFMLTSMICRLAHLPWGWVIPTAEQAVIVLIGCIWCSWPAVDDVFISLCRSIDHCTVGLHQHDHVGAAGLLSACRAAQSINLRGAPLVIASGLIIFWRESPAQSAHLLIPCLLQ
jgi:hypothetical protein